MWGALLAVLVLAGAGVVAWRADAVQQRVVVRERCVARDLTGATVQLDVEQAEQAATIAGVGRRLGVGERGVAVGLATAMQESKLHNIDYGDRDSVGLFQQRPSQGWGRPDQLLDPVYAATRFFRALQEVPSYERLALDVAAQEVQRSADGSLYAQHEADATVLAAVLTGGVSGGLSCALRTEDVSAQEPGRAGLTPRAEAVRAELVRVFGADLGVAAEAASAAGQRSPTPGRALVINVGSAAAERRAAWAQALWLVAAAERLDIASVSYDGRTWSAASSARGWQSASSAAPAAPAAAAPRDRVRVEVLG